MSLGVQRGHAERPRRGYTGANVGLGWESFGQQIAPCACGGFIKAEPTDTRSVAAAVRHHQRTDRHLDWRGRRFEDGTYIVGRVVVTPEGTFLERIG